MAGEKRDWRDAKIPQWAKDSISDEMREWKLSAALSWPTEPEPEPLPFGWGEYDRVYGEPVPGVYYSPKISLGAYDTPVTVKAVHVRVAANHPWRRFEFSEDGEKWSFHVVRDELFASEAEARLWAIWRLCEVYAKKLARARGWL